MRGKFLRSSILGIKGFCGTRDGSISIITFLLFNWGWSDKDDWRAKWRLMDEMTTEGRNDDWRTKWRLKGEMTTEGRNDDWRAKWRLKDEMTTEGRNDDWRAMKGEISDTNRRVTYRFPHSWKMGTIRLALGFFDQLGNENLFCAFTVCKSQWAYRCNCKQ